MPYLQHAAVSRRVAVQAGAVGLLGLGMNHLAPLRAMAKPGNTAKPGTAAADQYSILSGFEPCALRHFKIFEQVFHPRVG